MTELILMDEGIDIVLDAPQPIELVLSMANTLGTNSPEALLMTPWLSWIQPVFPTLWQSFVSALKQAHPWFMQDIPVPQLSISVVLLNDETMQALNSQYRNKNSSTDVLTFSLLLEGQWQADADVLSDEESGTIPDWQTLRLPGMPLDESLELGEIYLSLSWVLTHATPEAQNSSPMQGQSQQAWRFYYLTERLIHGFLHLLGVHHDTLSDYNKVVAIQQQVLSDAFRALPPAGD